MKISSSKLKKCRKQMGLTSQEFANLCGIPAGTYFSYEAGGRNPKSERLRIIAGNLCVSLEDITESDTDYLQNQIAKGYKSNKDIMKERVQIDTKLLKIKRKQNFKNAYELAKYIGVCISVYYTYERGTVNPTREIARKICNALNLDFYRLVIE